MAATRARGHRRPLLTAEMAGAAGHAARVGLNNREIIEHLGVGARTFYRWQQEGEAHLAAIEDANADGRTAPRLTEHQRLCVDLVQALTRARVRVYEEIAGTALAEALGGGKEVTVREKTARIEIDGEYREIVVERITTTSYRAPNPQLLTLILTRRYRHAWGSEAMPTVLADDGERDAVLELLADEGVQEHFRRMEEAIGRAQEEAGTDDRSPKPPAAEAR